MNITFGFPSTFDENLLKAIINFTTANGGPDNFKMILMRDDFVFSSANHLRIANVTANTGAIAYYVVASSKTIDRTGGGSFITDGFVVGNYIKTNSGTTNKGPYVVTAVTASQLQVELAPSNNTAIINEGTSQAPVTFTITCEDELATGNGYTRNGRNVLFSVNNSVLRLDSPDWSYWAAALYTTPGGIIYDYTESTTPKAIICYARFTDYILPI